MKIEDHMSAMERMLQQSPSYRVMQNQQSLIDKINPPWLQNISGMNSLIPSFAMDNALKSNLTYVSELLRITSFSPVFEESLILLSKNISHITSPLLDSESSLPVGMMETLTQLNRALAEIGPLSRLQELKLSNINVPDYFFDLYDSFIDELIIECPDVVKIEDVPAMKERPKTTMDTLLNRVASVVTILGVLFASPVATTIYDIGVKVLSLGVAYLKEYKEHNEAEEEMAQKTYEENKAYHAADLEIKKQILESVKDSNEDDESGKDTCE